MRIVIIYLLNLKQINKNKKYFLNLKLLYLLKYF
jgi:hypothetical protein